MTKKEKYLKYQAKYRKEHKEELRQYFKNRWIHNKEELQKKIKIYRESNKEKIKKQHHEEYLRHKDKYLARARKRTEIHKQEINKYKKEYYVKNKKILIEKARIRNKQRRKKDLNYRLTQYLRSRLWWALKGKNKSKSTMKLIGCSIEKLKKHLEFRFKSGMSWSNYGKWHIDHIHPCAVFDLTNPLEQRKCFHYTNLQPLWAKDNLIKKDKLIKGE